MYHPYVSDYITYGDIIFIDRHIYYHFGIYRHDHSVIHYYSSLSCDSERDYGVIEETTLSRFRDGGWGEIKSIKFHEEDTCFLSSVIEFIWPKLPFKRFHNLYSPVETIERATSRLGEKRYNFVNNNCEHFAFWCKTGETYSGQVEENIFGRIAHYFSD